MKITFSLVFSICVVATLSCSKRPSIEKEYTARIVVADTIQYSVDIKADSAENPWIENQIKRLDSKLLVNQLFESVYRHQAKAYSFLDNRLLTLEEVKEMEISQDYDRDLAARLHFWECWSYNPQGVLFEKRVLKVMIAYESRTEEGELKGYKAGIVIEMNE